MIKEEPEEQNMEEEEEYGWQQFEASPEINEYEDILETDGNCLFGMPPQPKKRVPSVGYMCDICLKITYTYTEVSRCKDKHKEMGEEHNGDLTCHFADCRPPNKKKATLFKDKTALRTHFRRVHGLHARPDKVDAPIKKICIRCGADFVNSGNLKRHMKNCHKKTDDAEDGSFDAVVKEEGNVNNWS